MYLVVDRGNTRTKMALFGAHDSFKMKVLEQISGDLLNEALDELLLMPGATTVNHGIYASVAGDNEEFIQSLNRRMNLLIMSDQCPLPVKNSYTTPATLGNDRIAAAVGATTQYPGFNILSIDAGTCITFDFTSADKEYLGGGITPGLQMRFKALHTFTSKLPLVSLEKEATLIGKSTVDSIRSGVLNGVIAEVDGMIDRYRTSYPDLKIILTGGDANYFDGKLKNNIFVVPNLVLLGLKDILKYNVEK
jgi:type III pantothenate kinase